MTATPAKWAGVIAAAEQLAAAAENWSHCPRIGAPRLAAAAGGLLAELANLWAPAEPAAGVLTSPGAPAAGADDSTLPAGEAAPAGFCDARAFECRCRERAGHYRWPGSPHRCDPRCGGAWWGDPDGRHFEVAGWPQGIGPAALLYGVFPGPIPGLGADEEW